MRHMLCPTATCHGELTTGADPAIELREAEHIAIGASAHRVVHRLIPGACMVHVLATTGVEAAATIEMLLVAVGMEAAHDAVRPAAHIMTILS